MATWFAIWSTRQEDVFLMAGKASNVQAVGLLFMTAVLRVRVLD